MIAGLRPIFVFVSASCLGLAVHAQTPDAGMTPPPATPPPSAAMPSDSTAPATTGAAAVANDPAVPLLKQAYKMVTDKNLDGALSLANDAVKTNPKSFAALTLRGMIYSQKKDWMNAQSDFNAALALDPQNVVVKFNLGEIHFVQKQYDQARAAFVPLESDPAMGDFASYKVFLCDLFGGHEDVAAKELAVFNAAESHPSYYFGNAAWDLVHKNTEDARGWLTSAANIYIPAKNQFYASSLRDLGYLPLPPAPGQ